MGKLILVRHGKSEWNVKNIFTGWTDVDLAPAGIEEARKAGKIIKSNEMKIDICFSSFLKRAIRTAWILLDTADMMPVDTHYHWKLNERHYGAWQGRDKDGVKKEVGEKQFTDIRRGYNNPPPKLSPDDDRNPKYESHYQKIDPKELPLSESLADTSQRVENYFYEAIVPQLAKGKTVLVVAHGNTLRALVGHLEKMGHEEIADLEIRTGVPLLYEFEGNLKLKGHRELS